MAEPTSHFGGKDYGIGWYFLQLKGFIRKGQTESLEGPTQGPDRNSENLNDNSKEITYLLCLRVRCNWGLSLEPDWKVYRVILLVKCVPRLDHIKVRVVVRKNKQGMVGYGLAYILKEL